MLAAWVGIWVATLNGIDQFRELAIATHSRNLGLASSVVTSVLAARNGDVWLGTQGGLNRWATAIRVVIPFR